MNKTHLIFSKKSKIGKQIHKSNVLQTRGLFLTFDISKVSTVVCHSCGKPASGELHAREIPGSLDGLEPSPGQWPTASAPLIVGRPAGLARAQNVRPSAPAPAPLNSRVSLVGLARAQDILCAISPHPKSGAGTNCSGTVAGRAQINVHPQPQPSAPATEQLFGHSCVRDTHSFDRYQAYH